MSKFDWKKEPTKQEMRYGYIALGIVFIVAALWFIGNSIEEKAVPETHHNLIKHLANATSAGSICKTFSMDPAFGAIAMVVHGIEPRWLVEGGRYFKEYSHREQENIEAIIESGIENYCGASWLLYGETGLNVPGLLVKN